MPLSAELWNLYEEWKRLTQTERGAITSANWSEVRRCQRGKEQLQPKIVRLTEKVKGDCSSSADVEKLDSQIRQYVNELIGLERENSDTLSRSMDVLQRQRGELQETAGRLRRLHKSYVPTPAPVWNGYS